MRLNAVKIITRDSAYQELDKWIRLINTAVTSTSNKKSRMQNVAKSSRSKVVPE